MSRKRNIDNKTLDAIGRTAVRSSGIRVTELERVVSGPELYSLICKRIASGETTERSWFGSHVRQHVFAAAGAAILLMFVVGVAVLLRPAGSAPTLPQARGPARAPVVAPPVFPPQGTNDGKLSAGGVTDHPVTAEKAVLRETVRSNRRSLPRPEPLGEFYAVSFAGDPGETSAGTRVIRVELDRSALFALGANVPLENGDQMIKADLLVGKDGVTRGVRLVD